ncbi:MAG: diguanylate phosphodiesterase, partial [Clostridium paraputrificum]
DEEIKDALLGKENNLRKVLELVLSYENMNINRMEEYCEMLNLDKKILIDLYMESIEWSNRLAII